MDNKEIQSEYYDNHELTAADLIKHLSELKPDCKVRVNVMVEDMHGVSDYTDAAIDVGRWKVRDHEGKGGSAKLVVIEASGVTPVRNFNN